MVPRVAAFRGGQISPLISWLRIRFEQKSKVRTSHSQEIGMRVAVTD